MLHLRIFGPNGLSDVTTVSDLEEKREVVNNTAFLWEVTEEQLVVEELPPEVATKMFTALDKITIEQNEKEFGHWCHEPDWDCD